MKEEQRNPSGDVQYVLNGGALRHRVQWSRGSTYESVSHLYDPTTKDATNLRRTGDCVGVTVHFASGKVR